MGDRIHGTITIKNGKVVFLKNIADLNAPILGNADLHGVLQRLSDAGWKLEGDYELENLQGSGVK